MSEIAAMIRHMRAKGLACDVILDAVEAMAEAKDHALEERRAADRARKSRERAAKREALKTQEMRHVTSADILDSADTETPCPLVSPPLSPTPPNTPPIIPPSSEKSRERAAKREPNGSRLAADWTLPDEWRTEAARIAFEAKQPLTEQEIRHEADRFRDYWHAAAGAKGRKSDWLATWRNWVRSYLERRGSRRNAPNGHGSQPVAQHGRGSIAAAAARREHERQNRAEVSGEFEWGDSVEGAGGWHGNHAVAVR